MVRAFLTLVLIFSLSAKAESLSLQKAQDALLKRQLLLALRQLKIVAATGEQPKSDVALYYQLLASYLALAGTHERAVATFVSALTLQPIAAPIVADPLIARALAVATEKSKKQGTIALQILPPKKVGPRIKEISVKISNDSTELARTVAFHYKADNDAWIELKQELVNKVASFQTDALGVQWFAIVLGERSWELSYLGSEDEPMFEGTAKDDAPKKKRVEISVKENPELENKTLYQEKVVYQSKYPALKPLGIVFLSSAAVAIGTGIYFGVRSQNDRNTIARPKVDDLGNVTSLTQKDAQKTSDDAVRSAIIANSLYGTGAALAVGGALCLIFGRDLPVKPSVSGFVVSGNF